MHGLIAVVAGGGIGAYLRHFVTVYTKKRFQITCKNTFVINIIGCFLLGIVLALVNKVPNVLNNQTKLFLTTGIIGSFTTFSTFAYENILLLKDKEIFKSFAYTTLSLVLGVLAVFLGFCFINLIF